MRDTEPSCRLAAPGEEGVGKMMAFKPFVLDAIAKVHLTFFQGELPDTVAIYFHEVEPEQRERLDEALSFFVREGYRTILPGELASPGKPGDKRLFLSFDDNFSGWHGILELLERHDTRGTFYLNTGPIRDRADPSTIANYFTRISYGGADTTLSRAEIRDLHAAGHNIGCHTRSHPRLSKLPRDLWDDEILRCKAELEELVGEPVVDFSFPFGMRRHFSPELRDYCAGIGFRTIATGISGLQHSAHVDPLNIHRTLWCLSRPLEDNLARLRVRSSLYAGITGRSAVWSTNLLIAPLALLW